MGPRRGRHARRLPIAGVALALALAAASCATPLPTLPTLPTPVATTPAPTIPPAAERILDLLAERDAAQQAGDVEGVLALVAPDAPGTFRDREAALVEIEAERGGTAPQRRFVALRPDGPLPGIEVAEDDDQGRTRRVRYFVSDLERPLLSEPTDPLLGELRSRSVGPFEVRWRAIDDDQAETAALLAESALATLVTRLGETYRPTDPFFVTLVPTVVPDLPAVASAYYREGEITLLTSQTMIVPEGEGAEWSAVVVGHELAHHLLFRRGGGGPFVFVEGIPLWLTDDRREPELRRLVERDAIWTLDHLLAGPRSLAEFYPAYAQASSFVRYLAGAHGDRAVIRAWEGGRRGFAESFQGATGVTLEQAYAGWRDSLGVAGIALNSYPRVYPHPTSASHPAAAHGTLATGAPSADAHHDRLLGDPVLRAGARHLGGRRPLLRGEPARRRGRGRARHPHARLQPRARLPAHELLRDLRDRAAVRGSPGAGAGQGRVRADRAESRDGARHPRRGGSRGRRDRVAGADRRGLPARVRAVHGPPHPRRDP